MHVRYYFFLLIIALFLLPSSISYSQTMAEESNIAYQNTTEQADNDSLNILTYSREDAINNASSFITLIGLSPLPLLKEFANKNNVEYSQADAEDILRQKIIKDFLGIDPTSKTVAEASQSIARNNRGESTGDIVLYHADIIEAYEMEGTDEEVLIIYGNIELKLYDYNINSDKVVYSVETGEVFASGNIVMTSEDINMSGHWFLINKDSKAGVLYSGSTTFQTFAIEGNILKFRDDVFIIDDAKVSFSKLNPKAHSLETERILLWDESKIMLYNGIYSIGKQPMIWIPLFLQNNFGTGIITALGQSTREGIFIQNYKTFTATNLSNTVRFDVYQKLGVLFGDELRYNTTNNTISFDAMIAIARKYALLEGIPSYYYSSSYYGNYFLPNGSSEFDLRYRFDYSQSFILQQNSFMTTKINGNLIFASDLYFKSDFYNQRGGMGIFDVISSFMSSSVNIGDQTAESQMTNSLNIVNTGSKHSISLGAQWNLEAVRNLSAENNVNFDYEKPVTTSIVLPSISASYSDTIGSYQSYYLHGLNINYSLTGSYSHTINYVPTEGIYFEDNPNLDEELSNILSEKDVISLGGSLSRAFTNSFTRYTPSINVLYNQQITKDATAEELIYDEEATYTSLANTHSLSFFLPSTLFPTELYNYFQPSFSFNNNYNLTYRIKENYYDYDTYGGFYQNSFTSSLSLGGTAYGIFYLKNLNLYALNTTQTGYDFRPNYNYYDQTYYFENDESRILSTYTSTTFKLSYSNSYISYNINYNILEDTITANSLTAYIYHPIELTNAIKYIFGPLDKQNYIDKYLTSFNIFAAITYKHDFKTYLYNYLDFKFGINVTISELWKFEFAINSKNSYAFRYVPSYAEAEGYEYVNFFEDVINSVNFFNMDKISSSLLKLQSISATLWHDLDGWDMSLSFSISPQSLPSDLTTGSIKGYYWDKAFAVEFKLVEFDGLAFPKIEPDLNTEIEELRNSS